MLLQHYDRKMQRRKETFMELKTIGMLAVIAIYLIMMVVIGVIYSKKNNEENSVHW